MLSRRSALLSAFAACVAVPHRAHLQPIPATEGSTSDEVTILRVHRRIIEVNGRSASVLGVRQPDGTAGLFTEVGKRFRVRVENELDTPTLLHWHGLTPPWRQDGVPGVSRPPISPGSSADYDFPLRFGGTFWMHSHQGLQEQLLLAAPLIIRDGRNSPDQQEVVLTLADFSFTPPEEIFENLRKKNQMSGMNKPFDIDSPPGRKTPQEAPAGIAKDGRSPGPDLNDVKYDAFLANDRTLADPDTIQLAPGQTILLRVINSSAMSSFHIDLGQLNGNLIAVDGFRIHPVEGRRFPISVAQRLDILIRLPKSPASFPILAILEGERSQTGMILNVGRAPVARIAEIAPTPSPPLSLELERQLRALVPLADRKADRVHRIDLTGSMNGYVWSINNVSWNKDVSPLPVANGERVELVLENKTRMPHPMHLHGHEFQVVEIDGIRFSGAVRDTVLVTPGSRVVIAFDANNPGRWAFHCHLAYHQAAGMFNIVSYI